MVPWCLWEGFWWFLGWFQVGFWWSQGDTRVVADGSRPVPELIVSAGLSGFKRVLQDLLFARPPSSPYNIRRSCHVTFFISASFRNPSRSHIALPCGFSIMKNLCLLVWYMATLTQKSTIGRASRLFCSRLSSGTMFDHMRQG